MKTYLDESDLVADVLEDLFDDNLENFPPPGNCTVHRSGLTLYKVKRGDTWWGLAKRTIEKNKLALKINT